jgi:hypothetical protein
MRHPGRPLATLTCILLAGGVGRAADHMVVGKKLLLRTPAAGAVGNRVVHVGTNASITVGQAGSAGDPRCVGAGGGGASSLRIAAAGSAGDVTIPLFCSGWSLNGAQSAYRYKDASGATCKLVLVKDGALVKAVCKGAQVAIDLGAGAAPVTVVTTLNTDQFCAEYGGTVVRDGSDGSTLLHKDAAAPSSCPTTSTSTTATSTTTTTTLACCILYAGQCTWTTSEVSCIIGGGVAVGPPGSVCDGVTGGCTAVASPGYCCAYPGVCTSGPTGDPVDCVEASGTVYDNAICAADGTCN